VNPKLTLELDHPLGIARGPLLAVPGESDVPHEQVHGIEAETDRDLALP
jgi:hypothetical protein